MKRSRLKPGKPLARKSEMPRGKGLKSAGELVRKAAKKRSRPKPAAPKSVVDIIKDRSVACEIGLICLGMAPATESAHRRGKGSGGVGKKNATANTASNLLRACLLDHRAADGNDLKTCERLGIKLRHTPALPCEVPVRHWEFGWVLLQDDGKHVPAPESAIHETGPLPVVLISPEYSVEDDERIYEAWERFGHGDCGGYELTLGQPVLCDCGSTLFVVTVRPNSGTDVSDLDGAERRLLAGCGED